MCQTKIATFEHYFQLLSNLKIIIIQRRRNIWVFLNFYSRFNHVPARAFAWLSVQSFRLLSRAPPACPPDLLPIHSLNLLPACSPLSFFRISRFFAYIINTRALRATRVHISPARSRVALDYVVCQNVVLIRRKVHVLQFLEGGNRFRVCRVKSGIMAKNPKVNINVFSSLLIFGMV